MLHTPLFSPLLPTPVFSRGVKSAKVQEGNYYDTFGRRRSPEKQYARNKQTHLYAHLTTNPHSAISDSWKKERILLIAIPILTLVFNF